MSYKYQLSDPSACVITPVAAVWSRQPEESSLQWERFSWYLVNTKATMKDVAEKFKVSYRTIRESGAQYRWTARRKAYLETRESEARAAMVHQSEATAMALHKGWREAVDWAIESALTRRARGELLDARTIGAVLKAGTDALRLLEGEATSRVEVNLSGLSQEKLDELSILLDNVEDDD